MRDPLLVACLSLAVLGAACDSDSGATDATVADATLPDGATDGATGTAAAAGAGDTVSEVPVPEVTWTPCEQLAGEPHARVECADVVVPLDWDDPSAGALTLFVKRVRADDGVGPRRALWFLMGGPGQAGADAEGLVPVLAARDPGLDFYLPDHRGTGRSSRLACPVQEGSLSQGGPVIIEREWPACRDAVVGRWGDALAHFSSTQAGHDTAALIGAVHPPEDHVNVIGISYGTYLASRYLQVAGLHQGGLADAVVLDSVCAPSSCHLSAEDIREDEVARRILERCAEDEACRQRFPGRTGAWDALGELYAMITRGHCPIFGDPATDAELTRSALGTLMFGFAGRRAAPAFIHRMRRCADHDVAAIRAVYRRSFGWDPGASVVDPDLIPRAPAFGSAPLGGGILQGHSWPLAVNILVGELWEPSDPSPEELVARWEGTRSCRGVSRQASWQIPGWPRYSDPLTGVFPATDVPILAMNGDLDPATPAEFARDIEAHLTAPHQRYIEIPGAAHTVILQGQLLSDQSSTCGRELLLQFLDDPTAELDTSCLADTMPLGFSMRDAAVEHFFGTPDMWGDEVQAPETP